MLMVVEKGREGEIASIFSRYGLHAAAVGKVTGDGLIRVFHKGRVAAEVPADALAKGAPECHRPSREPAYYREFQAMDARPEPVADLGAAILDLLAQPTIASKEWAYEQYDHQVRTSTVAPPGKYDAAVVRIRGARRALAMSADCNGRYVYLDPRVGGRIAVAEAARNVVASGGEPIAVTDCMNYGSPENPEVFWQMEKSVEGIAEACLALGTPVVSGNVSLYNERSGSAIYPTPTIGMVGLVEDLAHVTPQGFRRAGDAVFLVGETLPEFGGSELQKMQNGGRVFGRPPSLDLEREKASQAAVLSAIRAGLVASAHDLSEGGLAAALAECVLCGAPGLGAEISLADPDPSLLFSESQSRFVVSVPEGKAGEFERATGAARIGSVTDSGELAVSCGGAPAARLSAAEMGARWKGAIPCLMG